MALVRILRLGLSDDTYGSLPDSARSWFLAARSLEEETGEPWETVLTENWPTARQPDEVERQITELKPNLVLFCAAAYWVSYPSVPLRLRRKSFPGARQVSRLGFWAANQGWAADRAAFHAARRLLTSPAAGAFYFEPAAALERSERLIRTILRPEEVVLAVRGPLPLTIAGSAAIQSACEQRRAAFDAGLRALCSSLHVAYHGYAPGDRHPRDELLADRIHVNARGHARRTEVEARLMATAWQSRLRE